MTKIIQSPLLFGFHLALIAFASLQRSTSSFRCRSRAPLTTLVSVMTPVPHGPIPGLAALRSTRLRSHYSPPSTRGLQHIRRCCTCGGCTAIETFSTTCLILFGFGGHCVCSLQHIFGGTGVFFYVSETFPLILFSALCLNPVKVVREGDDII